jgi:hypothetical protein
MPSHDTDNHNFKWWFFKQKSNEGWAGGLNVSPRMHTSLHWTPYCLLLALHSVYCAYEFHQNGPIPLIHDVINVPSIGFLFKK